MSSDNYIIDDKFKKYVTIYKSVIRQEDVYNTYLPIIKKSSNVSGTSSKYVPPNRQSAIGTLLSVT